MKAFAWIVLFLAAGCTPFHLQTPDQFVALDAPGGDAGYAYRATSADGVVLAVREIRNESEGDLQFWADAIRARLRLGKGYALLDEGPLHARTGQEGLLLRFGREEHGKPYRYLVGLFVTDARVFVLETGGRQDRYEARAEAVEKALASFEIGLGG